MFKITNTQTQQQELCQNRDELLSLINEKSVWAEDRGEFLKLQVEHLGEESKILDSLNLTLPLESIVEEAFSGFGFKKEKKSFSFLNRGKGKKSKEKVLTDQQTTETTSEQETPSPIAPPDSSLNVSSTSSEEFQVSQKTNKIQKTKKVSQKKVEKQVKNKKLSLVSLISLFLVICTIAFSITTFMLLQKQNRKIVELENRISLEEKQGEIEVVGRFFIANYYSGKSDNLVNFLNKDSKLKGLEAPKGSQVQSTIYESLSEVDNTIYVTFVVTTLEENSKIKTVRLTLPFQVADGSTYGYVLVDQPKISNFTE
ncbi:hypothetical protein [Streptococcus oralis]|uniref:hypothetical protein n=1 Tax=Streptococcus oralis TaxID=1303 RepID=UPI002283F891|nr:hypothetical protein [Streptococcus oralis]MCY7099617.1 hypothetical protein [Streptococcus oralis]MDU6723032.1 hypothetical protein [Streptococcus mitis]